MPNGPPAPLPPTPREGKGRGNARTIAAVGIIVGILAVGTIALLPQVLPPQIRTSESLRFEFLPVNDTLPYTAVVPVPVGTPLLFHLTLSGNGSFTVVNTTDGPVLRVTGTGFVRLYAWYEDYPSRGYGEAYLDYRWSMTEGDLYGAGTVAVNVTSDPPGAVYVHITFRASSNYCSRHDEFQGNVMADDSWRPLRRITGGAVCE